MTKFDLSDRKPNQSPGARTAERIVVVGCGGHARSVVNSAALLGFTVVAYVDVISSGSEFEQTPIISMADCLREYRKESFCIALGDNFVRYKVANELRDALPEAKFPSIIHPSSIVSDSAIIGMGSVVIGPATIGPCCSVGEFCIVNNNAVLDHDGKMLRFSSIAPGVTCGGSVTIGERAAVGIGSTLYHNISVGNDTVIGGGSLVTKSIPGSCIAYGHPCEIVKNRSLGEKYL